MQELLQFDRWLFTKINQSWIHPWMDNLSVLIRESVFWVPLYLFLLAFVVLNFKNWGWWWVLGMILTAVLGDLISSQVVKAYIYRYRPCRDPEMLNHVRLLAGYCGKNSSFTSSHATNHFAVATFMFLTLRSLSPWWVLSFLWAFAVAYAQVYVGVHYPIDVFCGGLLGFLIGFVTGRLFHKQIGILSLDKQ
jgi:membrane-associated phospholipid phosphatase